MSSLDANTIALVTLLATIASLIIALTIHHNSLKRNELSKIRDSVISRLENLSDLQILRDENTSEIERELVFSMHIKVLEQDINKYLSFSKKTKDSTFKKSLKILIEYNVLQIPKNNQGFRRICYTLLGQIDSAYFNEIKPTSFMAKAKYYYYELAGLFYGVFAIYLLFHIMSFIYS
ncbi:hypothetical protein [Aliivibrio logei]|uniref:Uncharacterized protein n=1 Tax=Aliivibrio logei 5S-186 TaxID=626086 RepID=A0ABX3AWE0_ALILO|nr:hypothetical protein [Aliivibrio logei]OEF17026.1 hypothetical protein A1Q5_19025 [Aliivibrio logei 5S-186]